jgi:hypothetical protein
MWKFTAQAPACCAQISQHNITFYSLNAYWSHFLLKKLKGIVWNEEWDLNLIDFKEAYVPIRKEFLWNIVIVFGIFLEQIGPLKMCLNERYRWVRVGKHLSDIFPSEKGLK